MTENNGWPGTLQAFIATHSPLDVYRIRCSAGLDRCKRLRVLMQDDPNLLFYVKREQSLLASVRTSYRGARSADGA